MLAHTPFLPVRSLPPPPSPHMLRPCPAGSLPPLQESYQTTGLPSPAEMLQQYTRLAAVLAPHVDLLLCETLASVAGTWGRGNKAGWGPLVCWHLGSRLASLCQETGAWHAAAAGGSAPWQTCCHPTLLPPASEGVAAGTAASGSGRPWWISWTLEDSEAARLRSGERLEVRRVQSAVQPVGIGLRGLWVG